MLEKLATHELYQGDHGRVDLDHDGQLDEVTVIFVGSMSIASRAQGKRLGREISLARRIELRRRMKWSDTDTSFIRSQISSRNRALQSKLTIRDEGIPTSLPSLLMTLLVVLMFSINPMIYVPDQLQQHVPSYWNNRWIHS
jgi:hypothetical protein